MILISHRGNINGKNSSEENKPDYINNALNLGYNVEIDVWFENHSFYLGHDMPQFEIDKKFLINNKIWCHAKNFNSLYEMSKINCHYFWHEEDKYTITSKGYIWAYPGEKINEKTICVLPERIDKKIDICAGICSDFIENYKK